MAISIVGCDFFADSVGTGYVFDRRGPVETAMRRFRNPYLLSRDSDNEWALEDSNLRPQPCEEDPDPPVTR